MRKVGQPAWTGDVEIKRWQTGAILGATGEVKSR